MDHMIVYSSHQFDLLGHLALAIQVSLIVQCVFLMVYFMYPNHLLRCSFFYWTNYASLKDFQYSLFFFLALTCHTSLKKAGEPSH